MTEYAGYGTHQHSFGWESGCDHYHLTEVMTIGKAHIWAGSRSQVEDEYRWDLVINLLGHNYPTVVAPVKMNQAAQGLLPAALSAWKPIPVLSVDWSDGGTPVMDEQWWDMLYDALLKKVDGHVGIHCQGGHGRTGTALAILAAKAGLRKKGCPVLWVRKNYCSRAVETSGQIKYIEKMTGMKVKALAANAIAQQKREAEEAERARKAALLPPPLPATTSGATTTEVGSPPPGPASGADEWVWDRESNSLVRKSEQNMDQQDWEGSHWSRMY